MVSAEHTERARWIAWRGRFWWIFDNEYCGERTDGKVFVDDELDFCRLLRGHTGPHSYDRLVDLMWPEASLFDLSDDHWHHPRSG